MNYWLDMDDVIRLMRGLYTSHVSYEPFLTPSGAIDKAKFERIYRKASTILTRSGWDVAELNEDGTLHEPDYALLYQRYWR